VSDLGDTIVSCGVLSGWNLQSSLFKEMGVQLMGNLYPPFLGKFHVKFRVRYFLRRRSGGLLSFFIIALRLSFFFFLFFFNYHESSSKVGIM
jgi:hypothetical protein